LTLNFISPQALKFVNGTPFLTDEQVRVTGFAHLPNGFFKTVVSFFDEEDEKIVRLALDYEHNRRSNTLAKSNLKWKIKWTKWIESKHITRTVAKRNDFNARTNELLKGPWSFTLHFHDWRKIIWLNRLFVAVEIQSNWESSRPLFRMCSIANCWRTDKLLFDPQDKKWKRKSRQKMKFEGSKVLLCLALIGVNFGWAIDVSSGQDNPETYKMTIIY
jgi:hypothetical protein